MRDKPFSWRGGGGGERGSGGGVASWSIIALSTDTLLCGSRRGMVIGVCGLAQPGSGWCGVGAALRDYLAPLATMSTPNTPEAEALWGE